MSTLQEEIDGFHEFVTRQLRSGCDSLTLEECLRQWRAEQEREEISAAVQRAVADMEAGRFVSLEQADREIREELGMGDRSVIASVAPWSR